MTYRLLTERELAKLSLEEMIEYANELHSKGTGLLYSIYHPESKIWRRIEAIREGEDPDEVAPKKKTYQKVAEKKKPGPKPKKEFEDPPVRVKKSANRRMVAVGGDE